MLLEDAATWAAQPTTPARARALVERLLVRGRHDDLVPTAALLTSEVVTNAVVHTDGPVDVRARFDDERLRVEVRDASPIPPRRVDVVDDAVGGRGVRLVDALSSAWGTSRIDHGKIVWFELMLA
jgi:anti-sigma regulatory factor (Ser/Thr protein kinase)